MIFSRQPPKEVVMDSKYTVFLTDDERTELDGIAKKGKNAARVVLMSLVLLLCDTSPGGKGPKTNF
jgi:hypothetical protein